MCGRFAVATEINEIRIQFQAEPVGFDELRPAYNIAPTRNVLIVRYVQEAQARHLELMKWGLVPSWAKDEKGGSKLINARAETITEKPSFRKSFEERRLIVPADGFYEWHVSTRDPYFIRRRGGEMLGFAGIWDRWKNPGGEVLHSFSIITGEPNELVAPIHNRMPVILPPEKYFDWLSPSTSVEDARSLLQPLPAEEMEAWLVSKAVNNPRNDSPSNLERLNSL